MNFKSEKIQLGFSAAVSLIQLLYIHTNGVCVGEAAVHTLDSHIKREVESISSGQGLSLPMRLCSAPPDGAMISDGLSRCHCDTSSDLRGLLLTTCLFFKHGGFFPKFKRFFFLNIFMSINS